MSRPVAVITPAVARPCVDVAEVNGTRDAVAVECSIWMIAIPSDVEVGPATPGGTVSASARGIATGKGIGSVNETGF